MPSLRALATALTLSAAPALLSSPALADRAPPPREQVTVDNHRLILKAQLRFEADSDTLTSDSRVALRHIANYLEDKSYISTLRIEGHVATGDAAAAQALSEKRALAVARRLVDLGVECKRLLPVGFGATKPVAAPDTAEGRAANTRIEAVNAALRDRPIGGMPLDGGGKVAGDACAK